MIQNHNRHSIRLKDYDYSQNGLYFITFCTKNHSCILGNIKNSKVILNPIGKIVNEEIIRTTQIRKNIKIPIFTIMPNHIHLIIEINNFINPRTGVLHTPNLSPININDGTPNIPNPKFKSPKNSIGSIIRGIKSASVRGVNQLVEMGELGKKMGLCDSNRAVCDTPLRWQRNYYDHIIRDEKSYLNIVEYIKNNPIKWELDKFYKTM